MIPLFPMLTTICVLAAAPASEEARYYAAKVRLQTDALTERMPEKTVDANRAELEEGVRALFSSHDIKETADNAAELTIELRWAGTKTSTYDVRVACERPDGGTHTLAFELLGDHFDVLGRLESEMPKIVGWLEMPDAEPGETPVRPSAPPASPGSGRTADPVDQPAIGPMGWTGVGLMAAGFGPLIAGAVLLPRTRPVLVQVETPMGFESRTDMVRKHPLALTATLVGVGGVVVATGVGLLAGDIVRRKKTRASVQLSPTFAPTRIGATITGRF